VGGSAERVLDLVKISAAINSPARGIHLALSALLVLDQEPGEQAVTCKKCEGAGFIEYVARRDGKDVPLVQQCCDVAKYAAEIKRRFMVEVPPAAPIARPFKLVEGDRK
jgi:hypothetical protein